MELLDTFPAFERYWSSVESLPVRHQIDRWETDYMAPWPELLEKQKRVYRNSGVSWRRIARTRVFPRIPGMLPRLRRLHANLLRELPGAWARTRRGLRLDFNVRFVIHLGLGCGAGWATELDGRPAVLFGLENAAELTSGRRGEWPGAVSHEVAHLLHGVWRARAGQSPLGEMRGPYVQLYTEGFATECERSIEKPSIFRLRTGRLDWVPWCRRHRAELARAFLRDVRAHRSVRSFFGSWYNIHGHTECGYYLGADVVRDFKRTRSLREIALWTRPQVRDRTVAVLRKFAATH